MVLGGEDGFTIESSESFIVVDAGCRVYEEVIAGCEIDDYECDEVFD